MRKKIQHRSSILHTKFKLWLPLELKNYAEYSLLSNLLYYIYCIPMQFFYKDINFIGVPEVNVIFKWHDNSTVKQ